MIRYYGIYAKHHKHEDKLHLFIPKEKRRFCTTSFCYVIFDLTSIISYFFKKRNFLYGKKPAIFLFAGFLE